MRKGMGKYTQFPGRVQDLNKFQKKNNALTSHLPALPLHLGRLAKFMLPHWGQSQSPGSFGIRMFTLYGPLLQHQHYRNARNALVSLSIPACSVVGPGNKNSFQCKEEILDPDPKWIRIQIGQPTLPPPKKGFF
jgi:hypothetical protein